MRSMSYFIVTNLLIFTAKKNHVSSATSAKRREITTGT